MVMLEWNEKRISRAPQRSPLRGTLAFQRSLPPCFGTFLKKTPGVVLEGPGLLCSRVYYWDIPEAEDDTSGVLLGSACLSVC